MSQFDPVLKMYADNGLRTVEDWKTLGRDIEIAAEPRTETLHRGVRLPLYSRGQTHVRPRAERKQPAAVQ
jgi:hypothetical protein